MNTTTIVVSVAIVLFILAAYLINREKPEGWKDTDGKYVGSKTNRKK